MALSSGKLQCAWDSLSQNPKRNLTQFMMSFKRKCQLQCHFPWPPFCYKRSRKHGTLLRNLHYQRSWTTCIGSRSLQRPSFTLTQNPIRWWLFLPLRHGIIPGPRTRTARKLTPMANVFTLLVHLVLKQPTIWPVWLVLFMRY